MTEQDLYKLKYPIGEFNKPDSITSEQIQDWIASIEALPNSIDSITKNLVQS